MIVQLSQVIWSTAKPTCPSCWWSQIISKKMYSKFASMWAKLTWVGHQLNISERMFHRLEDLVHSEVLLYWCFLVHRIVKNINKVYIEKRNFINTQLAVEINKISNNMLHLIPVKCSGRLSHSFSFLSQLPRKNTSSWSGSLWIIHLEQSSLVWMMGIKIASRKFRVTIISLKYMTNVTDKCLFKTACFSKKKKK